MANSIPFIGSKISLISKARIRYEGILNEINTKESTVSLEQVKVFGTEGRAKEGEEIPPSDNVYEFIVFRGADILDISVKESPSKVNANSIQDPAILSMPSKPKEASETVTTTPLKLSSSATSQTPQPSARIPTATSAQAASKATTSAIPISDKTISSQKTNTTITPMKESSTTPISMATAAATKLDKSSTMPTAVANPNINIQKGNVAAAPEKKLSNVYNNLEKTSEAIDNRKPARHFDQREEKRGSYQPNQYRNGYRNSHSTHHYGNYNQHHAYGHGREGHHRHYPMKRDVVVPKGDFDIQSSNAKFEKDKTVEEIIPEIQNMSVSDNLQSIHTTTFYDKSSSFFDNISCDAKEMPEKKDHRQRVFEEKKLNVETFGRDTFYQYRGGYGRGGYRRGGHEHHYGRGNGRMWSSSSSYHSQQHQSGNGGNYVNRMQRGNDYDRRSSAIEQGAGKN